MVEKTFASLYNQGRENKDELRYANEGAYRSFLFK